MKILKSKALIYFCLLVFTVFSSGFGTNVVQAEQVSVSSVSAASSTLKANVSKVSLPEGDYKKVKLTYKGKSLKASKASWSTSNSAVATVKDGEITAKKVGKATITAEYKNKEVDIEVTVTAGVLKANIRKAILYEGDTKTVKLTYSGHRLSGSKADWSTSNSAVATVDEGKITAKSSGTATITAKYDGKEVEIKVTVNRSTLTVNDDSITMDDGDKKTVKLKYNGKSISASKAKWTTSKSSVATVKDGVIRAKDKGTATITATYKGKEVTISVKVK